MNRQAKGPERSRTLKASCIAVVMALGILQACSSPYENDMLNDVSENTFHRGCPWMSIDTRQRDGWHQIPECKVWVMEQRLKNRILFVTRANPTRDAITTHLRKHRFSCDEAEKSTTCVLVNKYRMLHLGFGSSLIGGYRWTVVAEERDTGAPSVSVKVASERSG